MSERFVKSSSQRRKVLGSLGRGPKTASDISNQVEMRVQNVSRALKQLKEHGLVRCTTPERNMNRTYELTGKGEEVENALASQGLLAGQRLETKIANLLNRSGIPYSRNKDISGEIYTVKSDFYVSTPEGDELVIEAKVVQRKPDMDSIRGWAFSAKDLKDAVNGLKAVLFIKGTSREEELGQKILRIKGPDHFDKIFFEDELAEFRNYVEDFY